MDRRPTVSIITPARDAARFIAETVGSVREQTFGDWEMIVVDDGSTDGTAGIVKGLAHRDGRIRFTALPDNRGVAPARNVALDQARGRYVCFLDSHDLWLPRKLERQLAFMEKTNAAISYTAYRRMSEDGSRLGQSIAVPERLTYRDLLGNSAIPNLTAMVDRERVGPFTVPEVGHEDYALWLSLLRRGVAARGLDEDLARYRVVGGSLSSRPLRSARWVWRIYRDLEKLNPVHAAWCLANYGTRAWLKRRPF